MSPVVESTLRRRPFLIALGTLYLAHLLVLAYVFPWSVVFSGLPFGGGDYQTHYHQTYRLAESMRSSGHFWAYEPRFLAGHPIGLIFDVDNKAHFLFSYGLSRLGINLASAYNLFSVLAALVAPLLFLITARLLGMARRAQLVVVALTIPVYYLDTASRFATSAGMISHVMVAQVSLIVIVLFWRMLRAPGRAGRVFFLLLLLLLPLVHLIHVWGFAILVGPLVILYLWHLRRLLWSAHLQVLALVGAVLVVNAYWLVPALRHFDIVTMSYKLGQAKPFYFFLDLFEILPFGPPAVVQTTLFRYFALAGAALSSYRWIRDRDERWAIALVILGWFFFLTYLSAYLPLFGVTEPYRFVLALTFAAVIFAGPFYSDFLCVTLWRGQLTPTARALLVLALVVLGPQIGRQVFASAPELIPRPEPLLPLHDPPPWMSTKSIDEPEVTLRMKNVAPDFLEVADYFKQRAREPGRILVEPWELGEFLGWATDRHILGGFPDRRMVYESANLFREVPDHWRYWDAAFADYLVRYNIRYLIIHTPIFPMIDNRRELLELVARIGPFRIYRTRHRGNYFLYGTGRIRTALNRIVLEAVQPDPQSGRVTIRFHYLETLRCRPSCRVVPAPIRDSRASFISVVGDPHLASTITLEHQP